MSNYTFSVGDVVVLRHGGPAMTVENPRVQRTGQPGIYVGCVWFDANQAVHRGAFLPDTLELVEQAI